MVEAIVPVDMQPDRRHFGKVAGPPPPLADRFRELTAQARRAAEGGSFDESLALLERARELAAEAGDAPLRDLATAYRAAIFIEQGEGDRVVQELREILLGSGDALACQFAAYNMARHHELRKSPRKALFYARLALERARELDNTEWVGLAHNLMGNALLADSLMEPAVAEYELALGFMPATESTARARVEDNIGYCRIIQGRAAEGFRLLYRSLRTLRRAGATLYQISTHLDLCFAHIQAGRGRPALIHGRRALAGAEGAGDREAVKNALYLLGEAAGLAGDAFGARRYFARLQSEFFPSQTDLPDFLLAVDVTRLVSLRA